MKIKRDLQNKITEASKKIGVITIMGPRQSGKTTLVKEIFPKHKYYNLEDIQLRNRIAQDPKQFIDGHNSGIILDEVQKYPDLLSYIQIKIDEDFQPARFVLTGSENLLLSEKVSQTLAGRVAIFSLLPLSISELVKSKNLKENYLEQLRYGFYPRIYDQSLDPKDLYPDYIATYTERDVRQVKNIGDLTNFQRFLQLLAGRTGQILNLSNLANDVGVNHKTIDSWISLLESTYIAFRLQPFYKNFGKRVIKSPKVYFYDTGLVCSLLGIDSEKELSTHSAIGSIFENMIVSDLKKQIFNSRSSSKLYFWRDSEKNEIDVLVKDADKIFPIEIKAGSTFSSDYLKGIKVWDELQENITESAIIYTGETDKIKKTKLINWKSASNLIP
ncbi:MAG: AAA family ATPase [Candidatus Pacebacteria bacterium CG_4_10_14_0_8_um_filter_42_14]|nr:MAG: AAA family ATPase [Candidatus Pacebacteria bacterium CG_4_10_14_0_8_um_filter_42_14]